MKLIKNVFSQLHSFVLWLLISVVFWGWIFTRLTDTDRNHKVTVFVDSYGLEERDLTLRLEEHLPAGIKMIKVHTFQYDLFSTGDFGNGDIYIAKQSILDEQLRDYPGSFAQIRLPEGCEPYVYEGQIYGIRIFDAETQTGPGMNRYIYYAPIGEVEPENYYLCFNAESPHLEENPDAKDNAAWEVAMLLLELDGQSEN